MRNVRFMFKTIPTVEADVNPVLIWNCDRNSVWRLGFVRSDYITQFANVRMYLSVHKLKSRRTTPTRVAQSSHWKQFESGSRKSTRRGATREDRNVKDCEARSAISSSKRVVLGANCRFDATRQVLGAADC